MVSLTSFSVRRPWWVILCFVALTAVALIGVLRIESEDDVFVFLPDEDPDVRGFREVSDRFGSLRVALIGAEARDPRGDVFGAEEARALAAATEALGAAPGVARVMSLANTADVVSTEEGAEIGPLLPGPPASAEAHAAVRQRVLALDHIVGNLVSADGRATTIYVYMLDGVGTEQTVTALRTVAERELSPFTVHYGGAAFAADAIYGEARDDVRHLSPVAALVLILVVLLSFRDPVGVALTLGSVGFATVVVFGAMGFAGERYTALTSTMPVILLATGSAYTVHVLGRYYLEREGATPQVALERASRIVARPLAIAAWTTAAAFLSFLVMDVRPMRAFGLAVAVGTLLCWFIARTLVPAVMTLWPRAPSREQLLPFGAALARMWRAVERRPKTVAAAMLLVTGAAMLPLGEVEVRMEAQAFLREGSPAWQDQRFFEDRFGGARFVQIEIAGDMQDPASLREIARLADYARSLPGVSQVSSLIDPLAIGAEVLSGEYRLPTSRREAAQVYLFLAGETGLTSLLTPDRGHALINARVRGEAAPVVAALEAYLAEQLQITPSGPTPATIAERLALVGRGAGATIDVQAIGGLIDRGAAVDEASPAWRSAAALQVDQHLRGDLAPPFDAAAQAEIRAAAGRSGVALRALLVQRAQGDRDADLYQEMLHLLDGARRSFQVEQTATAVLVAAGLDASNATLRRRAELILRDLNAPPIERASTALAARVTGEPVLDRALSRSVERNQLRSMAVGLVTVSALLLLLFRSLTLSLLCVVPAAVTAVVVGGVMGLMGARIDLSTAMVGAILTDTASDFGMHYVWYLRRRAPEEVARRVGPVMLVSTALVALGFYVFAAGQSTVMRTFGLLAGTTCLVSGLVTILLLPVVWPWLRRLHPEWSSARTDLAEDDLAP